jgi:ribosome-associated protein
MTETVTKKKTTTPKKIAKDLSQMLTAIAVASIQEKKGSAIVSMDLRDLKYAVTDFFVICHAESTTQVNAIANFVEDEIEEKTGERPIHKEGFENAEWILLDYFNIVVHVFRQEKREFYGVERLWADAKTENHD